MQFSLVAIVILACLTATSSLPADNNEPDLRARPIQTFFKNIFNALRRTTTEAPPTRTTKRSSAASYYSNIEFQEIPNFVDFSTYLLDSFASNNSAIKFSYMQPNTSGASATRAANYSVISFLVPHDVPDEDKRKGIFSFLNSMRLPWNREPSNTDYSQFPPLLEYFTQRVQAYFSVYKYTDDSRLNNTIVFLLPDGLTDDSTPAVQSYNAIDDIESTTEGDSQLETTTILLDEIATTEVVNEV